MLSRYALSFVSNPRNEMSMFVTSVADLVKEEYYMTMLHSDINMSRLMVYAQSIIGFKLSRISRNLKRSGSIEKNQPRFNKKDPFQ